MKKYNDAKKKRLDILGSDYQEFEIYAANSYDLPSLGYFPIEVR